MSGFPPPRDGKTVSFVTGENSVLVYKDKGGGIWEQFGDEIKPINETGSDPQARSTSLSGNGEFLSFGVSVHSTPQVRIGAVWIYKRTSTGYDELVNSELQANDVTSSYSGQGSTIRFTHDGSILFVSSRQGVTVFEYNGVNFEQSQNTILPPDVSGGVYGQHSISTTGTGDKVMFGKGVNDNWNGAIWFYLRNATTGLYENIGGRKRGEGYTAQVSGKSVALASQDGTIAYSSGTETEIIRRRRLSSSATRKLAGEDGHAFKWGLNGTDYEQIGEVYLQPNASTATGQGFGSSITTNFDGSVFAVSAEDGVGLVYITGIPVEIQDLPGNNGTNGTTTEAPTSSGQVVSFTWKLFNFMILLLSFVLF